MHRYRVHHSFRDRPEALVAGRSARAHQFRQELAQEPFRVHHSFRAKLVDLVAGRSARAHQFRQGEGEV
ncbi:MAG TPA: hypothetical protein VK436_12370 [Methanocella sp.]|nr:hypothetical protein [Methanocella sp.]